MPAEVQQFRIAGQGSEHGRVAQVQVIPDIARRVTVAEPMPDQPAPPDLDAVVHQVLIIGLALSTLLMLIGVGLELLRGTALPNVIAGVGDLLPRLLSLRPSGFLTLGLLVLIATPILRVVGSIVTFIYERDWRFAGITTLVLLRIRSVLVAPLRVHDRATGVLRIYATQLRRFSTEEIGFVCTVADLGALAIENAKLHELLKARLEALQADSNAWQRFLSFS